VRPSLEIAEPPKHIPSKKENFVKKYSSIAALMFSVAGLLVPARAQEAKVIVTVPFEFIVGIQTLPAGSYTVTHSSAGPYSALFLASQQQGMFLLPSSFDVKQLEKASLAFDQVGEKHLLKQIETPQGIYTIDDRREMKKLTKLAQSKEPNQTSGMTSSGAQ
jgi:hypothetical protein